MDEKVQEFLMKNKYTHFLQSPEWAKVKDSWKNEFIVSYDKEGNVKGTMSILLRKVPIFNRYMMYAPRGFVCDIHDKETLADLTNKMKDIAKKYNAFIIRMDPCVRQDDDEFKKIASELGYKQKKNIKGVEDVIQPKFVMQIDISGKTEEEVFKNFHEKTRYNVRLATKKGVTVREGTKEDLGIFHDIMETTGQRDDFFIRGKEYFEKIYDNLHPNYMKLLIAEFEGKPIAVVMPIIYGNKVWYLYGGSTNEHRNLMPTYLLQWEMIKLAVQNNCDIYDFRGVTGFNDENSPQYGVYRFKKGFGGEVVEFVDELSMVFSPFMNTMWNITYSTYQKMSHMKSKIKEGIKKFGR